MFLQILQAFRRGPSVCLIMLVAAVILLTLCSSKSEAQDDQGRDTCRDYCVTTGGVKCPASLEFYKDYCKDDCFTSNKFRFNQKCYDCMTSYSDICAEDGRTPIQQQAKHHL